MEEESGVLVSERDRCRVGVFGGYAMSEDIVSEIAQGCRSERRGGRGCQAEEERGGPSRASEHAKTARSRMVRFWIRDA